MPHVVLDHRRADLPRCPRDVEPTPIRTHIARHATIADIQRPAGDEPAPPVGLRDVCDHRGAQQGHGAVARGQPTAPMGAIGCHLHSGQRQSRILTPHAATELGVPIADRHPLHRDGGANHLERARHAAAAQRGSGNALYSDRTPLDPHGFDERLRAQRDRRAIRDAINRRLDGQKITGPVATRGHDGFRRGGLSAGVGRGIYPRVRSRPARAIASNTRRH